MKTRTISALVALPILFFVLWTGGWVLYISAFLISILGMFEFYRAVSKRYRPMNWLGYLAAFAWFFGLWFGHSKDFFTFVIAAFLFSLMAFFVFEKQDFLGIALTFLGFFYVAFSLSHVILISDLDQHFFIWYPFIIAFSTDTFAYAVGRLFGKTPLIPEVSPKKTVEGAIGGVIFCLIFSYLYAVLFNPSFQFYAIFLGLTGSILSQVGDLMASKIKRVFGLKDFGKIMPGHGGILDRIDSLIVTLPVVYYFMVLYQSFHTTLFLK